MENKDAKDYQKVKQAILQRYNINEETYQQSFCFVKHKEEDTPSELVTRIRGLAKKWLKKYETREQVIDTFAKEQFKLALPEDVRVWVMERKPSTSAEAGQLVKTTGKLASRSSGSWSRRMPQNNVMSVKRQDTLPGTVSLREKKRRRMKSSKGAELICFNCRERGHTSRQCPSKVMFCGLRRKVNRKRV